MAPRTATGAPERFRRAVDALVAQLRDDRAVLAAILCGSLSHDTVWDKSDVDLVLVTIDDRTMEASGVSLWADGVNVHAWLVPRATLRRLVDGALRQSFLHSFFAKGRLLYTHDESLPALLDTLRDRGARDTQIALQLAATEALPALYKARKFLETREDLSYTTTWILAAAQALARLEVISAGELADREVLPRARALNPAVFGPIYTSLLDAPKTDASVREALAVAEGYLAARAPRDFALILDHLADEGEARSATDLEAHFARSCGIEGVTTACEYLADLGLLGKGGITRPLTRRSNVPVQELAFHALRPPRDG